jgi:hypothetical protein
MTWDEGYEARVQGQRILPETTTNETAGAAEVLLDVDVDVNVDVNGDLNVVLTVDGPRRARSARQRRSTIMR